MEKDYPQTTLDNLIEGCQVVSPEWKYLYVNSAVVKQAHKPRKELLGHTMMEVYPGIEHTAMFDRLRDVMQQRRPYAMENEFAFAHDVKGWFELRMEPVARGVLILSIDITERKLAEQHHNELEALKDKFVTIAAHQLRTPLTIVRWSLEELLDGQMGPASKKQTDALHVMYQANADMRTQVDDLLTAIDIETSRINFDPSPTQLEDLLRPTVKELSSKFQTKKLSLEIDYPPKPLPQLQVDPKLMRSVFYKLLDNAATYTGEGGKVQARLEHRDNKVRFEIRDTGIGIPLNDQATIFERFARATNASTMKASASGLGLYIAQHLVAAHGGQLGFSSIENQGSTFWFELPISK